MRGASPSDVNRDDERDIGKFRQGASTGRGLSFCVAQHRPNKPPSNSCFPLRSAGATLAFRAQWIDMSKKMLIDATHAEETRVVVVDGNKVEEFDFETVNKRQLAGNIYLAKVTRVEPSLQAAFVDYGGNRHGFLAFDEIHPDYYQTPVADRSRGCPVTPSSRRYRPSGRGLACCTLPMPRRLSSRRVGWRR